MYGTVCVTLANQAGTNSITNYLHKACLHPE